MKSAANGARLPNWGAGRNEPAIFIRHTINALAETASDEDCVRRREIVVITKLSQPFVIATLSPTQITALIGNNTMWSDADSMSVTYLKKG